MLVERGVTSMIQVKTLQTASDVNEVNHNKSWTVIIFFVALFVSLVRKRDDHERGEWNMLKSLKRQIERDGMASSHRQLYKLQESTEDTKQNKTD